MNREKCDGKPSVVIIGSGPAGILLGILLARRGYPVAVLEKETGPHRQVCGEYLSPQGVSILEDIGLGDLLDFRPLRGMKMVSPRGKEVRAPFPEGRHGLSLNRKDFLSRLASRFQSLGGLLFYGETLKSFRREKDGILVETELNSYHCHLLVGADGRSSQVARLAGLHRLPGNNRVAIHTYLKPKTPLPPYGQMHILPDGSYAGINPISDEEVNFSIVADSARLQEMGGAKNLVQHSIARSPSLSGEFELLKDEQVKTTFPIRCERKEIISERIALIGDASGFIDPLTGEGITTAIKTARLLAEKLYSSPDIPSALAAYASARRADFAQKETLNHILQRVIRWPLLCEGIALLLQYSTKIRSLFIGVIGNIYTPAEAALKFISRGERHDKDRISTKRISPAPPLPKGGDSAAADGLAGPCPGFGATGENFRG